MLVSAMLGWPVACMPALVQRRMANAVLPCSAPSLQKAEGATRHAAVLVDLKNAQGNVEFFLVVAMNGQAGDEAAVADRIEDILQMAMHSGFRFLLLGDFNLVPAHPMLLDYLADGTVIAYDECQPGEQLPPTGPVYKGHRRRRIDFGLSHFQWPALDIIHLNGPSDHLVALDAEAPLLRIGPVRRCLKPSDMLQNLDVEFAQWDAFFFESICAAGDLDEAWRLLSNVAEDLVCVPDASAIPRSEAWQPREAQRARCMGKRPERSPGLRALLKLQARIRVGVSRPRDIPLWQSIRRSLAHVRAAVPELPYFQVIDVSIAEPVDALVATYTQQEVKAAKVRWLRRAKDNLGVARSYVKRRADQQLEWERTRADLRVPTSGRHPAMQVDIQDAIWIQKWRRCDADTSAAVVEVLREVPRPPEVQVSFQISAPQLQAALRAMRHKSHGPDHWTAEALLLLPATWWDRLAALWQRVLELGGPPRAWFWGRSSLIWKPNGATRPITVLPFVWRMGAKLVNQQLADWCNSWCSRLDAGGIVGTSIDKALQ